jgi:hypothetical protein
MTPDDQTYQARASSARLDAPRASYRLSNNVAADGPLR